MVREASLGHRSEDSIRKAIFNEKHKQDMVFPWPVDEMLWPESWALPVSPRSGGSAFASAVLEVPRTNSPSKTGAVCVSCRPSTLQTRLEINFWAPDPRHVPEALLRKN